MVWSRIVSCHSIGPYMFDQNSNGHSYLQLLRGHLPGLLKNVDLATKQRMWLQQDSAAPHYAFIVRAFLNNHYNNGWIRRSGPVAWPPCSPDLTSPDFYLR